MVRVGDERTEEFRFEKGVRQGCLILPVLFNAVGERIIREVKERLEDERPGKITGARNLWNIRYADDTTTTASYNEDVNGWERNLEK